MVQQVPEEDGLCIFVRICRAVVEDVSLPSSFDPNHIFFRHFWPNQLVQAGSLRHRQKTRTFKLFSNKILDHQSSPVKFTTYIRCLHNDLFIL